MSGMSPLRVMVVLAAMVSSCGPTRPLCSSTTTCVGCCDATGECRSGLEGAACGRNGATCTDCAMGQMCTAGACTVPNGSGGGLTGAGGGSAAGGGVATGGGVAAGAACTSDRTCGNALCSVDAARAGTDLAPLALICAARGAGRADGEECVLGSECARGLCVVAGTCAAPCEQDVDCGAREWCAPTYARTGANSSQPVRVCIPVFSGGADVTVARTPNAAMLRGVAMATDDIDLPAAAATSLVALVPVDDAADPFFVRVLTREGTPRTVFFGTITQTTPAPDQGVNAGIGVPAILLPNGPRSTFAGQPLRAQVESAAVSSVDVRVLTRTTRGTTLDVHVFVVGVSGLSATAPLSADVMMGIEAFRTTYAAAGITLGDVRVHELVGGLRDRFARIEGGIPDPDLRALFRLSAGCKGAGIPWFFVRDIGNGMALAQSGGIPGPHGMHGTPSSGIAFALDTIRAQNRLGPTLIHETGHFLGLFHTAEARGFVIEPLDDTPECRIDRDTNGNGQLSRSECPTGTADNPMFWDVSGPGGFTMQQRDVLQRALLLR